MNTGSKNLVHTVSLLKFLHFVTDHREIAALVDTADRSIYIITGIWYHYTSLDADNISEYETIAWYRIASKLRKFYLIYSTIENICNEGRCIIIMCR